MILDRVKDKFYQSYLTDTSELKPCSDDEIKALERNAAGPFPAAYREFLGWMGHGAGTFLRGSHWQCEHLIDIQQWAKELLNENKTPQPLPEDAWVFFMHQGYQFFFFHLTGNDNPPIYYYNETEHMENFKLSYDHFSQFLLASIEAKKKFDEELEDAIRHIQASEGQENEPDEE